MKLTDLNPRWIGTGGKGITDMDGNPVPYRANVALLFDCPCGCESEVCLSILNPLGGAKPLKDGNKWERTGETFEDLTLHPSFQRVVPCSYHGWVKNGEIIQV